MENHPFKYLGDAQDVPALAWCARCNREIYRYDPIGDAEGELLHIDCLTAEEQEYTRIAPAAYLLQEV